MAKDVERIFEHTLEALNRVGGLEKSIKRALKAPKRHPNRRDLH